MTELNVEFTDDTWHQYMEWKKNDKRMVKKIDRLIADTIRHPFAGIGKPEPLQYGLTGYWSKKISSEHRMVYSVEKDRIIIIQLKYHYSK